MLVLYRKINGATSDAQRCICDAHNWLYNSHIMELLRSFLIVYKPMENIFLYTSFMPDLNNINQ